MSQRAEPLEVDTREAHIQRVVHFEESVFCAADRYSSSQAIATPRRGIVLGVVCVSGARGRPGRRVAVNWDRRGLPPGARKVMKGGGGGGGGGVRRASGARTAVPKLRSYDGASGAPRQRFCDTPERRTALWSANE
ncbi:unnamed protein product, partial [Iphiclides podalirius]